LSDIAQRAGLSRAAVSNYSRGERSDGFPPPVARVTSDMPLWDWTVVAQWLSQRQKIDPKAVDSARVVKEANLEIETRGPGHDRLVQTLENAAQLENA
jgi:transcriptional regulator with XRE-family HTH domain